MKRRWPGCIVLVLSLVLAVPSVTAGQEAPAVSQSHSLRSFIVVAGRLSIAGPGPYTLTAVEITIPPGSAALTRETPGTVLIFVRSGSLLLRSPMNTIAPDGARLEMGERLVLPNSDRIHVQNPGRQPARVVVVSLAAPALAREPSGVMSKGDQ